MGGNRSTKAVVSAKSLTSQTSVLDDLQRGEPALTLAKAAKLPQLKRDGRSPHATSVWRWCTSGVAGIRLEFAKIGGSYVTTAAAVIRFLERLSDPEAPNTQPTPATAKREHDSAGRILDGAGVR